MSAHRAADSTRLISITHYKKLFLFFLFAPGLHEWFCKIILSRDEPVVQKQGKDRNRKKTIHWYLTVDRKNGGKEKQEDYITSLHVHQCPHVG